MKIRIIHLLSIFAITAALQPTACWGKDEVGSPKSFRVFDCTIYPKKPDLAQFGIKPIRIIYGDEMFGIPLEAYFKRFGIAKKPYITPPYDRLLELGKKYRSESLVVLDYEGLEAYDVPKDQYRNDIAEYVQIVKAFKAGTQPNGGLLGYFQVPPIADLGRIIYGGPSRSLRADNDLLKPLVDVVGVLFPALYTRDPDPDDWHRMAAGTLAESRRIAQGKPVYAFIWPRYLEVDKSLAGQLIPRELWRQQLEYVYQHADGVVIWDGNQDTWNDNWPWWQETKAFLKKIGRY